MPQVFISYSHGSPSYQDRVLALSNQLRAAGVDCCIDQYEQSPAEGWPQWCDNQIEDSDFVLVVCSETCLRRYSRGKYAEAEPLYQRALAISEKALGRHHPNVAYSVDNLAALYYRKGDYAVAEPFYQRALSIREQALGPNHPLTVSTRNNLALNRAVRLKT